MQSAYAQTGRVFGAFRLRELIFVVFFCRRKVSGRRGTERETKALIYDITQPLFGCGVFRAMPRRPDNDCMTEEG